MGGFINFWMNTFWWGVNCFFALDSLCVMLSSLDATSISFLSLWKVAAGIFNTFLIICLWSGYFCIKSINSLTCACEYHFPFLRSDKPHLYKSVINWFELDLLLNMTLSLSRLLWVSWLLEFDRFCSLRCKIFINFKNSLLSICLSSCKGVFLYSSLMIKW